MNSVRAAASVAAPSAVAVAPAAVQMAKERSWTTCDTGSTIAITIGQQITGGLRRAPEGACRGAA